MNETVAKILNFGKDKVIKNVLVPIDTLVDDNITDITTTIGAFVIRNIKGRFQRSITFTINLRNEWMVKALYEILYKYNKINNKSNLNLTNKSRAGNAVDLYYELGEGVHNLKYRKWNILLVINTEKIPTTPTRTVTSTKYTIINYDIDPEFMNCLVQDMIASRNAQLKISKNLPYVQIFRDEHESDGYTYWSYGNTMNKRKLNTIYLPKEQKKLLVDTINNFIQSKEFYKEHGIPWNLKILLHGIHGSGKSSIVRMIASEWNRSLCECTGGKNGRFIPNALTDPVADMLSDPLFSISDIDKYPALINEAEVTINDSEKDKHRKDDVFDNKEVFAKMINALDGIGCSEGSIIIMTTNHIEKFSDTFLRPGRIDLIMEIGYITAEVFREFVKDYYGFILPQDITLKRNDLTIAELQADVVFFKLSEEEFVNKYVGKPEKKKATTPKKEDK